MVTTAGKDLVWVRGHEPVDNVHDRQAVRATIKQIAERVMGASEEDLAATTEEKKSLLGGFDLKSLLAKKEKSEAPAPAE